MPRKPTLTGITNSQSHSDFKDVVAVLGQKVDARTDRHHAVRIDGRTLGERESEMRAPGTNYFFKSYLEANAVAHLAVNLGLDQTGVVDVVRQPEPQPDVQLTVDGTTLAFVEQTMVMDQAAHRLTLDLERLNALARSTTDPAVRAAFDNGMLNLRFNAIPATMYDSGLPIDDLVGEIFTLARELDRDVRPIKPEPSRFPLLAAMNTLGSYRIGSPTANPVMILVDHGRPATFENVFRERIVDKRRAAAGYPPSSRPLWLLLDVDMHFGFHDYSACARAVIADEAPTEFDRIIVQQTHFPPLVLDLASPST